MSGGSGRRRRQKRGGANLRRLAGDPVGPQVRGRDLQPSRTGVSRTGGGIARHTELGGSAQMRACTQGGKVARTGSRLIGDVPLRRIQSSMGPRCRRSRHRHSAAPPKRRRCAGAKVSSTTWLLEPGWAEHGQTRQRQKAGAASPGSEANAKAGSPCALGTRPVRPPSSAPPCAGPGLRRQLCAILRRGRPAAGLPCNPPHMLQQRIGFGGLVCVVP
jgi:hypothetical protein